MRLVGMIGIMAIGVCACATGSDTSTNEVLDVSNVAGDAEELTAESVGQVKPLSPGGAFVGELIGEFGGHLLGGFPGAVLGGIVGNFVGDMVTGPQVCR